MRFGNTIWRRRRLPWPATIAVVLGLGLLLLDRTPEADDPLMSIRAVPVTPLMTASSGPGGGDVTSAVDPGWWRTVQADLEAREYQASISDNVLQAPNRAHNVRTHFREGRIEITPRDPRDRAWQWGWTTSGWGREDAILPVSGAEPMVEAARVTYDRGGFTEWYTNDARGVEQGFTITTPPAGQGRLCIRGTLGGDLTPRLAGNGDAIDLLDGSGAQVLRYAELHASDLDGTELEAEMTLEGALVQLLVDDESATYPITIDPIVTAPSWHGELSFTNTAYGHSVSTAGDVNGDGYSDVIVGAPHFDGGSYYEGCARVYLGSASGLSTTSVWHTESNQQNAFHGWSVSMAGDVNGDGYDDVIVGAKFYDGDHLDCGRATVYHGNASGVSLTAARTWYGEEINASLGCSVAWAGDVNGDGYDDVIVGAENQETSNFQDGKAWIYLGSASGLAGTPVWSAHGSTQWAHFGHAVATAGDVNGDGYDDVIVGTSPETWSTDDPGYAYVYHGNAAGMGGLAWSVGDDQVDSWFAFSVSTAGDVNGDGYADVIIGAPYYNDGLGRALIYHGSSAGLAASPGRTLDGTQLSAQYGLSVATVGDVNGDALSDVIIGAPNYTNGQSEEGRVFVHLGSLWGVVADPIWMKEADQVEALFGYSVATAGDVNGDGFSEVLVGSPYYDDPEEDEGVAFVYHGGSYGPKDIAGWVTESNQVSALYGSSVAGIGDASGDGIGDVMVGAPQYDNGQSQEGAVFVFLGSQLGLETLPAWWAESNTLNGFLGNSVACAGDVDGNGLSDAIVGAYYYRNTLAQEGAAFIWLSRAGMPYGNPGNADWAAYGGQEQAWFGFSVAGAGDVNADGFADVVVGAPLYSNPQEAEGAAFAYFGSASGPSPTHDWFHDCDHAYAEYGHSVAGAGDFNGDGYSDIIVGTHRYDAPTAGEGAASVYIGSETGPQTGAPWWWAQGNQSEARLGWAVASAGDVNGDGFSDVIVGAPWYDAMFTDGGGAYVWYGAETPPPVGTPDNADWSTERGQANACWGYTVSTAGDVNGDGYSDVLVGSPFDDNTLGEEVGLAAVWFGSPSGLPISAADWLVQGPQDTGRFAESVAFAGDVNGDGYGDVIIGAPWYDGGQGDEGRVFLYYGNTSRGLPRIAQQFRTDLTGFIAPLGLSNSETAFGVGGLGRTPAGRGRVKMEWEAKPFRVPFDGEIDGSTAWFDTGVPSSTAGSAVALGALVDECVPGLGYRWRLRFFTDSPFSPRSPWFYLPYNGGGEMDLRMAGELVAVEPGMAPWAALRLGPARPNPFNPVTTVRFDLAAAGRARLTVHDVSGRLVRTLVDEDRAAGEHEAIWDGRTADGTPLASGVYFIRLASDGQVASQRAVLTR